MALGPIAAVVDVRRARRLACVVEGLRTRQWIKNLLLFAGLVFGARVDDPAAWLAALTAFSAYCLASSAGYLLNDVLDAPRDRRHPLKRARPVARGDLPAAAALAVAAGLAVAAIVVVIPLGLTAALLVLAFLAVQTLYSAALKHVVLADVAAIASLFCLRAVAGADAVDVPPSAWLIACASLLALLLGLGKRRGELLLLRGEEAGATRRSLAAYARVGVDRLMWPAAAAAVGLYAVYALVGQGSPAMLVTLPPVALGVGRYLALARRRGLGEEPERMLLEDPLLLATVVAWALGAGVVVLASA